MDFTTGVVEASVSGFFHEAQKRMLNVSCVLVSVAVAVHGVGNDTVNYGQMEVWNRPY